MKPDRDRIADAHRSLAEIFRVIGPFMTPVVVSDPPPTGDWESSGTPAVMEIVLAPGNRKAQGKRIQK